MPDEPAVKRRGRRPIPVDQRRVQCTLVLAPGTIQWLKRQSLPGESLSQTLDRLATDLISASMEDRRTAVLPGISRGDPFVRGADVRVRVEGVLKPPQPIDPDAVDDLPPGWGEG